MTLPLSFSTIGSGPPLIILHGLFGSSVNWRRIAQELSTERQIFLVDLPNHGKSGWIEDMSYPSMAKAVFQWMRSEGIENPSMIGHSMGGKVAMTLALSQVDALSAIAVIDIAPVNYSHSHTDVVDAMMRIPLDEVRSRKEASEFLQRDIPDNALRQFLLQNLIVESEGIRWRINLPVIRRQMNVLTGFPPVVGVYTGPALFLYGRNSDYVRQDGIGCAKRYFPSAVFTGITNAGHWLHAEEPEQTVDAIRQFLSPSPT